jgi:hypothetical protein
VKEQQLYKLAKVAKAAAEVAKAAAKAAKKAAKAAEQEAAKKAKAAKKAAKDAVKKGQKRKHKVWSASRRLGQPARRTGTKYKKTLEPVAVFRVITGGALQAIGKFDSMAEASAAAGILGGAAKNGQGTACLQLQRGMHPAPEARLKEAFQGYCLFLRGVLLLYLHVPTWGCHHRCRHQSEA